MVQQRLTVLHPEGLHMRPAAKFVEVMGTFDCDVTIVTKDGKVNAKSILSIMAACIKCGAEIDVICEGSDEQEAMHKAAALIRGEEG